MNFPVPSPADEIIVAVLLVICGVSAFSAIVGAFQWCFPPVTKESPPLRCGDCDRVVDGKWEFLTEVNPPGGYGRWRVLVCDPCMRSGRWDSWIELHWPNWPDKPINWDRPHMRGGTTPC